MMSQAPRSERQCERSPQRALELALRHPRPAADVLPAGALHQLRLRGAAGRRLARPRGLAGHVPRLRRELLAGARVGALLLGRAAVLALREPLARLLRKVALARLPALPAGFRAPLLRLPLPEVVVLR